MIRDYGRFTAAMAKVGLNLRPISIRANVTEGKSSERIRQSRANLTERESSEHIRQYGEAGARYGIHLSIEHDYGMQCVVSRRHMVNVTMVVMDIETNDSVLVIEQEGPDGKCPPLTPVWDLLARELKKHIAI